MNRLSRIRRILLFALIPSVFAANFPSLTLARGEIMNYELTLPIMWLVIYFFVSLPFLLRDQRRILRSKSALICSLLPLYASISLIWTPSFARGFLTAGLLWLIFFAIISTVDYLRSLPHKQLANETRLLRKTLFITAALACIVCWTQSLLDVLGLTHEYTQLCIPCTSKTFGFPHPNGLAIEPQYMGNLLLIPALYAAYLYLDSKNAIKTRRNYLILAIFFGATLFLTMSRGAIFAYVASFILMALMLAYAKRRIIPILSGAIIGVVAVGIALLSQGVFSAISPIEGGFADGIAIYLNQVSLGIIDLPRRAEELPAPETVENPEVIDTAEVIDEVIASDDTERFFDGYVAESTDIRVVLSAFSSDLWRNNLKNCLFGVGYGGAGAALNQAYLAGRFSPQLFERHSPQIAEILFSTPKQIVQNEYFSVLLELGLAGGLMALAVIGVFIYYSYRSRQTIIAITLVAAFGISFCFLSGFTNVFHIYLLLPLFPFFTQAGGSMSNKISGVRKLTSSTSTPK